MSKEEDLLQEAFLQLRMKKVHQLNIRSYLAILKIKHLPTYEHSIRVGVTCLEAAEVLGLGQKSSRAMFWGGTLHDIGKALIDTRVLQNTGDFSKKDYAAVRPHPVLGYRLLKDVHPYTAELVVRHHCFQGEDNSYPKKLPKSDFVWTKRTLANCEKQARLLALIDYYDALTRRRNSKFASGAKTPEDLQMIFYDSNKDMSEKIDKLIKAGVLYFIK